MWIATWNVTKIATWIVTCVVLSTCASFDRTNIQPGQRVQGPALSFVLPEGRAWFASEYGQGSRMKLVHLGDDEVLTLALSLAKGPNSGMYQSAQQHLQALRKQHWHELAQAQFGYTELAREEGVAERYGQLCVRYSRRAKDWRGRNRAGPAMVQTEGLSCAHPHLPNALVKFELVRRHEPEQNLAPLAELAEPIFASLRYQERLD